MVFRKLLILLLTAMCACSQSSVTKQIPADAEIVVTADFKKLALQSIDPELFFSDEKPSMKDDKTDIWKDSGIDFLEDAALFSKKNRKPDADWYLLLPLSDAEDFRNFCIRNGAVKSKETGQEWLKKKNFSILVQEKLALCIAPSGPEPAGFFSKEADNILHLKEENNLLSHSASFRSLAGENRPIKFWANLDPAFSGISTLLPEGLFQGELSGSLDFPSGKITMEAKMVSEDSAKKESLLGPPIQSELMKNIGNPSETAGIFAISLAMQPIYKMLDAIGYSTTGSIMAAQYGLNLEEIMQTLSGEIVVSVPGEKDKKQDLPQSLLRLGLIRPAGDLLAAMSSSGLLLPEGNGKFGITGIPGIRLENKEKYLELITAGFIPEENDESSLQDFISAAPAQILCSISLRNLKDALPEGSASAGTEKAGKHWKNFRMRLDKDGSGNNRLTCSLECKNEDDNSLLVLMKSLNDLISDSTEDQHQDDNPPPVF